MRTNQYLDAVRQALDLPSDYAVAAQFCLTRSAVSAYRMNKSSFDDATALKVARALKIDPLKVMADMSVIRAKSDEVRAAWLEISALCAAKSPTIFRQKSVSNQAVI